MTIRQLRHKRTVSRCPFGVALQRPVPGGLFGEMEAVDPRIIYVLERLAAVGSALCIEELIPVIESFRLGLALQIRLVSVAWVELLHVMRWEENAVRKAIRVSQAVQDENNEVPLVADKAAVVRVYVGCLSNCPVGREVSGKLIIQYENGDPVTLRSVNPTITVEQSDNWQAQRDDLNKSLNFYIQPRLMHSKLRFQVELDG